MCSWKSKAPAGTSSSGLSAVMNSAWAMLVRVIAVKNNVMFSPKQMPGSIIARHVAALGNGRPRQMRATDSTIHHQDHRQQQPPERDRRAGRVGPLDDRRAAGEREDTAEDAEDASQAAAHQAGWVRKMSGST
ncbi:MAG: hypothetical protein M3487_09315 [Actinomycetota bacterium]|nr:hypothetical protein [Actinomycetota bacterium]